MGHMPPREWSSVSNEARFNNEKVHVARILKICVVKGAELSDGDPQKKCKGRAVLDGSWVKDENYDVALFNEMGSSPANMQAGKVVDAYGLQPNFHVEQADAEAAYTQCELKGTPTWVRLPEDRRPKDWFNTDKAGNKFPSTRTPCADYEKRCMVTPMLGPIGNNMQKLTSSKSASSRLKIGEVVSCILFSSSISLSMSTTSRWPGQGLTSQRVGSSSGRALLLVIPSRSIATLDASM